MTDRLLGIDYGDKRVGLALGEIGGLALPYKVISNQDREQLLAEIGTVVTEENIQTIVVGLPHSLSGQPNDRLRITQLFVDDLKDNFAIKVATVDETMTSKLFSQQGVKKDLDKHAAAAILDTYLSIYDRKY